MQDIVATLIRASTIAGKFDDHAFVKAQAATDPDARLEIRYSAEIARQYFGIDVPPRGEAPYYYWDTTTLALKAPLLEYVADGMRVLEIGPGPSATLSLLVATRKRNLRICCAELNPDFVASAQRIAARNRVDLKIVHSDMTKGVRGPFDVVFMNPPYVPTRNLASLKIDPGSHEGRSGEAGEGGYAVLDRFLEEVPSVLAEKGRALLGINTRHLAHEVVMERIRLTAWAVERLYYSESQRQPQGPYSQVYVLAR